MKISTLFDELNSPDLSWINKVNPRVEVYAYQPYLAETELLQNVVYLCNLDNLPQTAPNETCFLGVLNNESPKLPPNCNVLSIKGDLWMLLGKVANIFATEQKINSDIQRLMGVLEHPEGLQAIVDMAAEMLKSLVIVTDTSYRILAMDKRVIPERPDIEEQRRQGYLIDQTIDAIHKDNLYDRARKHRYPYYSKDPDMGVGWITGLVYVYGVEAAQVAIMEHDHAFTRYDYELSNFLCKLVSIELQKDDFYKQNSAMMHSILLSELLDGRIRDSRTAQVRSRQLGWTLSKQMRLLTIFDKNYGAFDRKAQLLAEQLHKLMPHSRWVIYENKLIFLLPDGGAQTTLFEPGGVLNEYLQLNQLSAAISEQTDDLLMVKRCYQQCIVAFDIGTRLHPERQLHQYGDYVCHHIGRILSTTETIQDFYHPSVAAIATYDQENETELLRTLAEYLQNVDHPTIAAEHLFIHKNTLFFRMNKIREQFGLRLDQGYERLRIQLTLAFLELERGS